jgi:hypothetical protein
MFESLHDAVRAGHGNPPLAIASLNPPIHLPHNLVHVDHMNGDSKDTCAGGSGVARGATLSRRQKRGFHCRLPEGNSKSEIREAKFEKRKWKNENGRTKMQNRNARISFAKSERCLWRVSSFDFGVSAFCFRKVAAFRVTVGAGA